MTPHRNHAKRSGDGFLPHGPVGADPLWSKVQLPSKQDPSLPNWEIESSENPVLATRVLKFGSQIASNSSVQQRTDAERETWSIESLDQGCLFLFTPEEQLLIALSW